MIGGVPKAQGRRCVQDEAAGVAASGGGERETTLRDGATESVCLMTNRRRLLPHLAYSADANSGG
jgi:hypothetical protein